MKKISLAFIIGITTIFAVNAQTPPLNKQQTVEYIEKLYKSTWSAQSTITSVFLDGNVFVFKLSSGHTFRKDLSRVNILKVGMEMDGRKLFYITETNFEGSILWSIQLESDANRLKKALERLIELVKAQKSTDPFDN